MPNTPIEQGSRRNLANPLPPSPPGKQGWPWTEGSSHLTSFHPGGARWPKISIVTPSYNQGHYLEETIRSVLLQGYPNLEYFVLDGGSTDNSVEIIRKYERWLTGWVSEKDKGQGDAINKGFQRATGEIVAWVNSDDAYMPGVLSEVAEAFSAAAPDVSVVYGKTVYFDNLDRPTGEVLGENMPFENMAVYLTHMFPTQAAFFRKSAVEAVGPLRLDLYYTLDWDYWLRLGIKGRFTFVDREWTKFRLYPESKTGVCSPNAHEEAIELNENFWSRKDLPANLKRRRSEALVNLYLKYARRFWGDAEHARARRCLWRAARSSPASILDKRWLRVFPRVALGARGQKCLSLAKQLLTGPWKPNSTRRSL